MANEQKLLDEVHALRYRGLGHGLQRRGSSLAGVGTPRPATRRATTNFRSAAIPAPTSVVEAHPPKQLFERRWGAGSVPGQGSRRPLLAPTPLLVLALALRLSHASSSALRCAARQPASSRAGPLRGFFQPVSQTSCWRYELLDADEVGCAGGDPWLARRVDRLPSIPPRRSSMYAVEMGRVAYCQ